MKIELDVQDILYTRLQKKAKAKKKTVESFILDKLETVTSYIYLSGGFYYCMEYDRLYNIRHAEIALTKRENKLFKILLQMTPNFFYQQIYIISNRCSIAPFYPIEIHHKSTRHCI